MVADGAGVALLGVAAAAGAQLGGGAARRPGQPGGAHRAQQQRALVGALQRRRLPAVEQRDHRVHVVDLDLAADVGAAEAELPRRPQDVGGGARRAHVEGRPVVGAGREPRPVPELDRERPLGDPPLDLAPQRRGACERHCARTLQRSNLGCDIFRWRSPYDRRHGRAPLPPDIQPVANETRDRIITGLVTLIPFVAIGLAGWQVWGKALHWSDVFLFLGLYLLTGLGITVGFHRHLTHRSFKAKPWLHGLLAILGSAAIEGPVISWVADHRKHHAFSDEEGDPHSPHVDHGGGLRGALRGLFHAHMGWLFIHTQRGNKERFAPDLIADPTISWVDRTFIYWAILGLLLPFALGYVIGGTLVAALTGLLWGGLVRVFVLHHFTYSINSLCHVFGNRDFETTGRVAQPGPDRDPDLRRGLAQQPPRLPDLAVHGTASAASRSISRQS